MTAAIRFREGVPEDRDAILALRSIVFADVDPEKRQQDFWTWEFLNGYAGKGRIYVAEAGGRVISHLGFVPQRYESMRGAIAVDAMTHPEFQRRKVFSRLARFAADSARAEFDVLTVFQFRKVVRPGFLAAGWRPSIGIPVLLKIFWGSAKARGACRALTPVDFAQVQQVAGATQPRSEEFLEWRFLRNAHWRYQLDGFFEGRTLCAFLVTRRTVLRGRRTLAIADAGVVPGAEGALKELVQHVCGRDGARPGLAAAMISRDHPAYGALRKSAFFPGPHRFSLMLLGAERQSWAVTWGDTDNL